MKMSPSVWQQFHDLEATSYDQLCFTQNTANEIEFLIEVLNLSPGDSILDVGCGTGRHSVELARKGYAITGIDLSAGMLAQARQKAEAAKVQVEWIQADASQFSLDRQFDAVICLCEGSFGLLGSDDDAIDQPLAILRNVSRALTPRGKTLFTLLNGFRMARGQSQDDVSQKRFDPLTMTTITDYAPGEDQPSFRLRERAFFPTELTLLFRLAGMSVLNIWGGTADSWNKQDVGLDEMEIMVLAENNSDHR